MAQTALSCRAIHPALGAGLLTSPILDQRSPEAAGDLAQTKRVFIASFLIRQLKRFEIIGFGSDNRM
jgi:hypothetical protein